MVLYALLPASALEVPLGIAPSGRLVPFSCWARLKIHLFTSPPCFSTAASNTGRRCRHRPTTNDGVYSANDELTITDCRARAVKISRRSNRQRVTKGTRTTTGPGGRSSHAVIFGVLSIPISLTLSLFSRPCSLLLLPVIVSLFLVWCTVSLTRSRQRHGVGSEPRRGW